MSSHCLGLATDVSALPQNFGSSRIDADLHLITGAADSRAQHAEHTGLLSRGLEAFLPFGPGMADPEVACTAVRKAPHLWQRALKRVAGCIEIVATATWSHRDKNDDTVGAENWLRHRSDKLRQQRVIQDRAQQAVLDAACRSSIQIRGTHLAPFQGGLDIALLIPRRQDGLARDRLNVSDSGITLTTSGPWPCFSFASPVAG